MPYYGTAGWVGHTLLTKLISSYHGDLILIGIRLEGNDSPGCT